MTILNFLLANWDSVLIVLGVIVIIIALIAKKEWGLLDKMLFSLVTWAEREYGDGTGSLKLSAVIERVYPHVPLIIRIFVTSNTIEKLIDKALVDAKERWAKNPALLEKNEIV